jgi:hypothetical protein
LLRIPAESRKNTKEGFLANIFNRLRRTQAPAELDLQQLAEVIGEVALDFRIAAGEALNVLRGEQLKLQA